MRTKNGIRDELIEEYMKARREGNEGRMLAVLNRLRGAESAILARRVAKEEAMEEVKEEARAEEAEVEAVFAQRPEVQKASEEPPKEGGGPKMAPKVRKAKGKPKKARPRAAKGGVKKARPKAPKPEMAFGPSKEKGRVVYAPGKAVILAENRTHYQVRYERDESVHAVSRKSARFKAFNEALRDRYKKVNGHVSIGDRAAKALNGLTVNQLKECAVKAGAADRFKVWSDLNPGMKRMNLGNVLRAMANNGETKKAAEAALIWAAKQPREE